MSEHLKLYGKGRNVMYYIISIPFHSTSAFVTSPLWASKELQKTAYGNGGKGIGLQQVDHHRMRSLHLGKGGLEMKQTWNMYVSTGKHAHI